MTEYNEQHEQHETATPNPATTNPRLDPLSGAQSPINPSLSPITAAQSPHPTPDSGIPAPTPETPGYPLQPSPVVVPASEPEREH